MTVISHDKKYVFAAVFKTGSSSIANMLLHAHDENTYIKHHLAKNNINYSRSIYILDEYCSVKFIAHSKSTTIKKILFCEDTGLLWDEYFKFGFVRNPWDRELSKYFFNNGKLSPPENISFKDFLNSHLLKDGQMRASNLPQCEYLTDVNYIARFENYDEEVKYIFNKIDIPLPNKLQHRKKTEHKPYWEYYDDVDIMKVEEWYKKDIEMYNYEFGK